MGDVSGFEALQFIGATNKQTFLEGPICHNSFAYQTSRLRCLFTDTSCPVIFRLPAFPVPPTLTFSSNSPPILLLHPTQTNVSGITSSRSAGISAPHILQCLAFVSIAFVFTN
jgi:hypothetical protein